MTPERWQQINAVFEEVQRHAETDRPSFLDRTCAGDQPKSAGRFSPSICAPLVDSPAPGH